jgi:alpha-amylase
MSIGRLWVVVPLLLTNCPETPSPEASSLECQPNPTVEAGLTCCRSNHPEGVAYGYELGRECTCSGPGACGEVCADSYCLGAGHAPSPECDACLAEDLVAGGACEEVEQTCEDTNEDCHAYEKCVKVSVGGKPGQHLPGDGQVALVSTGTNPVSPWNGKVVLQGFWWDFWNENYPNRWWDYLADLAPRLRELGIDAVWIPPSSKNAGTNYVGYSPFDHYDLGDKWQKGNVRTRAGTKDELLRMIAVMHANGIDVIQDIVLNHIDNAGAAGGVGGQDPAAWDDGKTNRYKNFRYVSYAKPGTEDTAANYLARSGRWPKNWQNFHANPGHNTTSGDWAAAYWGPDVCYQSGAYGESSNATFNPKQSASYMQNQARAWLVWLRKQTGIDGFRFDAIKHFEPEVVEDLLWNVSNNAGWASAGSTLFSVGEWVGNAGELDAWVVKVQGRSGTFDFSLRQALRDAALGDGFFDLGSLPGKQQLNRERTVPFVNSHDTMRPKRDASGNYTGWDEGQELGGHLDPFGPRVALAHAVAMAVDGAPLIYFEDLFDIGGTGKGYKHLPTDTTALPVREYAANLIWTHKMLGFKHVPYKVRWQGQDLLIIERSGRAIIGVNDTWSTWQNAWVATDFAPGTKLHDYSGANPTDIFTNQDGWAQIWVPPCDGSNLRRCYTVWGPAGIGGAFDPPTRTTTQEWEMADDLGDSHKNSLKQGGALPAKSTAWRLAGHVFSDSGKPIQLELTPTNTTQNLRIRLLKGSTIVKEVFGKGSLKVSYTPTSVGWYTIKVNNRYTTNAGQSVWLKATYTAPRKATTSTYPPPAP